MSPLPIVAQMTTDDDGNSLDGTPPETFAPELERAGADVIGVNCSVGPAAMLETIERMARLTRARLSAQPNAGRPRDVDGRNLYLGSPEYMASYARRFIAAGVRLVGGCCGTTPDHMRQISAGRARDGARRRAPARAGGRRRGAGRRRRWPSIGARSRALARAFADRQFVVLAEVAAPRGLDLAAAVVRRRAGSSDLGAMAVNVPDYPKAGARASALALASLIEQQGRRRDAAALLVPRSHADRACSRISSARTRWASATCC